jgi:hypothetical protein
MPIIHPPMHLIHPPKQKLQLWSQFERLEEVLGFKDLKVF